MTKLKFKLLVLIAFSAVFLFSVPDGMSAGMGMGGTPPSIQGVFANPGRTSPGGAIQLSVLASPGSGPIKRYVWTAPAGSFPGGSTTETVLDPSVTSIEWTAPAEEGEWSIQVTVYGEGSFSDLSKSSTVTVKASAGNSGPVIPDITVDPNPVRVDLQATLSAQAVDADGDPLSYSWSAAAGAITGDSDADPWSVVWTPPAAVGSYYIVLNVSDGQLPASSVFTRVDAIFAPYGGYFSEGLKSPTRIATDAAGNVYVTDSRRKAVLIYTPWGALSHEMIVGGEPVGVAVGKDGRIYVTDVSNGSVAVFNTSGVRLGYLGSGIGEFVYPADVAVDSDTGDIYVADGKGSRIGVYRPDLMWKADVPFNGSAATLWVRSSIDRIFVSDSSTGTINVLDMAGNVLGTYGGIGDTPGTFVRLQGIDLDGNGDIFAVDAFQGTVSVLSNQGVYVNRIGEYGTAEGQLSIPRDAAVDSYGRLLVASGGTGRLEVYLIPGATAPACEGDTDCDGMPDAWEIANYLDPYNPLDATGDPDGDGLTNIDEYLNGSNPHAIDSDNDGVSDFDEVNSGKNPADPDDQLPVAKVADENITIRPALLVLDGSPSWDPNDDPLIYSWEQISGPTATFYEDSAALARVLVKAAGVYEFRLTVNDGKADGYPATVTVDVEDVSPTADAGPDRMAPVGKYFYISGEGSRDANGDPITCSWSQISGPPTTMEGWETCRPRLNIAEGGVVKMSLTVTSGQTAPGYDELAIIAQDGVNNVPRADAGRDEETTVGRRVALDGSRSVDAEGAPLSYLWVQIEGPVASLDLTNPAAPAFTPSTPGVYIFSLTVNDGKFDSLPDEVTVVAHPVKWLPYADAGYDRIVNIGDIVVLDGSRSSDMDGDAVSFHWSQSGGPAVDLYGADTAHPRFGPPAPGVYKFDLYVSDVDGAGPRDSVSITVNDANDHVPALQASATTSIETGVMAALAAPAVVDPDADSQEFCWMQTGGPPIATDLPPAFIPQAPGIYTFDVTAFDGRNYSRSGQVNLMVWSALDSPPIADAGQDQLVIAGHETILDGSASMDPQGHPLAYYWAQTSGPRTPLNDNASQAASFYPPAAGYSYAFSLEVADPPLYSLPDEVIVNAVDVPGAIQEAGPYGNATIMLDGLAETLLEGLELTVPPGGVAAGAGVAVGLVWDAPQVDGYYVPAGMLFIGPEGYILNVPATLTVNIPAQVSRRFAETAEFILIYQNPWSGQWEELPTVRDGNVLQASITSFGRIAPAVRLAGSGLLSGVSGGGGRDESGFCFIATAAYGDYDAPRVLTLRHFRDRILAPFRFGRRIIHGYYRISPPIARAIMNHPLFGAAVRVGIVIPLAAVGWLFVGAGLAEQTAILFFFITALVFLARRRRGKATASSMRSTIMKALFIAAILIVPGVLMALDPPHNSTNNIDCASCHSLHNAPGMTMTKVAGNANLCLSCHTAGDPQAGARAFEVSDQAVPGTGGTSHRWDADVNQPNYGSADPNSVTYPAIYTKIDRTGPQPMIMCSSCHDQHQHDLREDANIDGILDNIVTLRNPFDPAAPAAPDPNPTSPAGRHYMRWPNDAGQMCMACHVARNVNYSTDAGNPRKYTGDMKSHPVGVDYPPVGGSFNAAPLEPNGNPQTGTRFQNNGAGDSNLSNNYVLDVNGQVSCLTCHGIHNADSNETTDDSVW